jgi:mono/diheme cytochrome c family protein
MRRLAKMRIRSSLLFAAGLVSISASAAPAQDALRGGQIARLHCARCHAVEKAGASPHPEAPPFRTLHRQYPVEMLEEALGEGIFTGHPAMPEFELSPAQIGDFIAFLKTLE